MRREVGHSVVLGLTVALLSIAVPVVRGASCSNCHEPSVNKFFTTIDQADPGDGEVEKLGIDFQACPRAGGSEDDFWIGVVTQSAGAALRSQLKLPEKAGLVIEKVHTDSPAETDGLQRNDILLSTGDVQLGTKENLDALIQKRGKQPIKFTVLRGGERKEVTVTPLPRKSAETADGDKPLSIKIMRPGQLVGPGAKLNLNLLPNFELPEDATVTITRHGKDKAKIKVEQKDKTWELTEDKLDELPAELRGTVAAMTRPSPFIPGMQGSPDYVLFADFATKVPTAAQHAVNQGLKYLHKHAEDSGADAAYRQALAQAAQAQRTAQQKLQQATMKLAELEERYRPSKVLEEDVTPQVESAVQGARQWSLEKLDSRFDQLQKQLNELRQAVKAARGVAKPSAPPAPPAPPAEPAPPAPPKTPEAP